MNKIFTTFNFLLFLVFLFLGAIAHLMYGSFQTSKYHFIVQYYYMRGYLPKTMQKDFKKDLKGYTGKMFGWYKSGAKMFEGEMKDGKANGKLISWYESGAKMSESEFKDGKLNGKTVEWAEKGNIIRDEEYLEDKIINNYLEPTK